MNGTAGVTHAQRQSLGPTVRSEPSPVPVRSAAAGLGGVSASGWTVEVTLHDAATGRRPAGVSGATVFGSVGVTPPDEIAAWTFEGNTGRTAVDVGFGRADVPGPRCG